MPFILLLSGLLLIYLALKKSKSDPGIKSSNSYRSEIKSLKDNIEKISIKLDKLENTVMVLNEDVGKIPDNLKENELLNKKSDTGTFDDIVDKNKTDLKSDLNTKIYDLHDEGNNVDEICSKLNIGKGEVLLRLGLRNQKK